MDWKKLLNKLLFPPVWLMVILVAVSAAGLTAVFLKGWDQSAAAAVVYALAFYTLSVVCVYAALVLPKQIRQIREKIRSIPLGRRLMTDRTFRSGVSLQISLVVDLAYVAIELWSWYLLRSWWFLVLAGYYVIMAAERSLLVGYIRRNGIGGDTLRQWKWARVCACILLLINLSLSGAVLMILFQGKGYDHPGIMIYVVAMYTFYSLTHAIIGLVKGRAERGPIMTASKIVSLSAALVSLLNLETAMFAQFGADMSLEHQRIFIILTGAGVSITVVTLSVIVIIKATKEIGRSKHGK